MFLPHTKIEKALLQENPRRIVFGIDEAGRGPLAGPVVAGAGWVNPEIFEKEFEEKDLIRDSKTLSERQRQRIFEIIQKNDNFQFGIGAVPNTTIDRINILNATLLAMRLAVDDLLGKIINNKGKILNKIQSTNDQAQIINNMNNIQTESLVLLIDGNRKISKIKIPQKTFIGGDRNIFSISVASICAKVWRDRLMDDFHKKYPVYGFNHHRGYGTKLHFEMIKKHGVCKIHRESFNLHC